MLPFLWDLNYKEYTHTHKHTQYYNTCGYGGFRLPDEEAGEIPGASVVMSAGAKESEEDMMNYVASNVAHYKKVRVVHFVEAIPKSPSGKIMRRLIKERMVEKMRTSESTTTPNTA